MAAITSELVKELRDSTNLPLMKCKQALEAANGDKNAAIEWLRKQGIAAADKKAGRAVTNGSIGMAIKGGKGAVVLLGCETDFVAINPEFKGFVAKLAEAALAAGATTVDALNAAAFEGATVSDAVKALVLKIGENIKIVEVKLVAGDVVAGYNHGGKIASLVAGKGDAEKLRQVAMHVASATPAPAALNRDGVDPELVAKEREILAATPDVQSKPEAMRGKIVEGKLGRFFKENVLLEQEMLLDAEKGETVEKYATRNGLVVAAFARLAI
jgi:elongation factor Ts